MGFGHLKGEYWLGLDKVHGLTINNKRRYKLRVDLEDTSGNTVYAEYSYFAVSSEKSKYQLSLGTYVGKTTLFTYLFVNKLFIYLFIFLLFIYLLINLCLSLRLISKRFE